MAVTLEEVMNVFPRGLILAWHSKGAHLPPGWAICDGTQNTPDLRGKFLRGVSDFADVGKSGGAEEHGHGIHKDRNRRDGNGYQGEGNECMLGGTDSRNHLPPFVTVLYIMKL